METTVFNVNGLTATDASKIKGSVNSIPGVSNVAIDVNTSKITITYDPATTDRASIKSSISSSGLRVS